MRLPPPSAWPSATRPDPVGPLVAEFLPDLARRVHIHIVFAQQILNRIALGNNNAANSPL